MSLPLTAIKSYQSRVQVKDIATKLSVNEQRVHYLQRALVKAALIDPKRGLGGKLVFTDNDFEYFETLQKLLQSGANTVSEAIRLMQNNLTPSEALAKYEQSKKEISQLQRKVLQLRKPFWWTVKEWFSSLFSRFKVVRDK